MATILHIETSGTVCSVCLSSAGKVLALRENGEGNLHASLLTPFIKEVLAEAGLTFTQLDALSLSMGPGSYTGLRIGASAAKAICYATGKPLIGIGTLQAMVAGYIKEHGEAGEGTIYCPMIDARRLEVYAALYNHSGEELKAPQPWIITPLAQQATEEIARSDLFLGEYPKKGKIICFGNGAAKAAPHLTQSNLTFDGRGYITSLNMIGLAQKQHALRHFVDIAYFEPYYLKTTTVATKIA